jgi:hypothetical protein
MNRIDTYIAQALEEFVTDTHRLLIAAQAHPQATTDTDVKDEIRFWKAQHNAFVKAQTYFLRGVRLTQTPSGYTVESASRPGALIHRMYKVGEVWGCSCEAGVKGVFHWHTALICGYERGLELADLGDRADAADDIPTPPAWMADEDAQLLTLLAA